MRQHARKHKHREVQEGAEVDLTPMIDVVFQLIIFFMVVTQITTQENVNLRLPDALAANPEDPDAERVFTVHIAPVDQTGTVDMPDKFGWFCFGEPRARTYEEMLRILREQGDRVDPTIDYQGRVDGVISENEILVRSDARAPSQEFGVLLELMVEAKIYRVKIAILRDQFLD
jgi:biopolymer transport protein ExbD